MMHSHACGACVGVCACMWISLGERIYHSRSKMRPRALTSGPLTFPRHVFSVSHLRSRTLKCGESRCTSGTEYCENWMCSESNTGKMATAVEGGEKKKKFERNLILFCNRFSKSRENRERKIESVWLSVAESRIIELFISWRWHCGDVEMRWWKWWWRLQWLWLIDVVVF